MANPRQRRKQRSQHKAVRHSNHAKKKLKKMPPIRGPAVLQRAWNNKLTVKQNYARLGLLSTVNPRAKGGSESVHVTERMKQEKREQETSAVSAPSHELPVVSRGRILRDEAGNIVDVEMVEDGNSEGSGDEKEPLARKWVDPPVVTSPERTDVVKSLQALSRNVTKVVRTASAGEKTWLKDVVAKYGSDFEAAARDRKLNPWQRTAGEIRRSITKVGGLQKLT